MFKTTTWYRQLAFCLMQHNIHLHLKIFYVQFLRKQFLLGTIFKISQIFNSLQCFHNLTQTFSIESRKTVLESYLNYFLHSRPFPSTCSFRKFTINNNTLKAIVRSCCLFCFLVKYMFKNSLSFASTLTWAWTLGLRVTIWVTPFDDW